MTIPCLLVELVDVLAWHENAGTGTCYNRPGLHQSWTASTSPSRRSAKRGTGRSPTLSAAPVRRDSD